MKIFSSIGKSGGGGGPGGGGSATQYRLQSNSKVTKLDLFGVSFMVEKLTIE